MTRGQILLGSERGKCIYELCQLNHVKNIVEIGTWYGGGSTACVLEAINRPSYSIVKNERVYEFFTLEIDRKMYDIATKNRPDMTNIHFIYGSIVKSEDLIKDELKGPQLAWLQDDVANTDSAPYVLDQMPKTIDFLILDGGEFSSKKEFEVLKDRTKMIFLDDTHALKNRDNRQYMLQSDEYDCIADVTPRNGHNGWSAFFKHQRLS